MTDSNSLMTFLTQMAALSTAVQTFVDHALKNRIDWLDKDAPEDPAKEKRRLLAVHSASFVVGFLLAVSVGLEPLSLLGATRGLNWLGNGLAAGLLVSFGGSFFNEALDAVRAFKKAQEGLRQV